jgi:uncharacterized membrane protein
MTKSRPNRNYVHTRHPARNPGGTPMNSLPLHPAIVHLPLALAVLMPILAAGFTWALWTGRAGPRAWIVIIALQGLLAASAFVAMRTGEADEDRVEAVVAKRVIHEHEEMAEQFLLATGVTWMLSGVVLLGGRRQVVTRSLAVCTVAATMAVAGLGLRVGHAGGELVYVHGAGAAYAPPASVPGR